MFAKQHDHTLVTSLNTIDAAAQPQHNRRDHRQPNGATGAKAARHKILEVILRTAQ
jgi:hypothetical protein